MASRPRPPRPVPSWKIRPQSANPNTRPRLAPRLSCVSPIPERTDLPQNSTMIWERLSYSLQSRLAEWAFVRVLQYAARTRFKDVPLSRIEGYAALECWRDHIAYPKATDDQIARAD